MTYARRAVLALAAAAALALPAAAVELGDDGLHKPDWLRENSFVVQMNLFGDVEVTDVDGETLSAMNMARRWGVLFTPTLMFFPEEVPDGATAAEAAVAVMPGAFGPGTTHNLLTWIRDHGYEGTEHFQAYHARMLAQGIGMD